MKPLRILFFGVLLSEAFPAFAIPDFANAIHYTPPPNYAAYGLTGAGDNPFSGDGPGFTLLANDQTGQIDFQMGFVGLSIGDGHVITYRRIDPPTLKKLLEQTYKGKLPLPSPATLKSVSGLTAARWTGEASHTFIDISWIQIETNLVLKITATAHDTNSFAALTNSLQTLTIDKAQFLESLQPKKPSLVTNYLDKIEVGYTRWRGRRTAAFVFRSKESTFCVAAGDAGKPEAIIESSLESLAKMRDLARETNVFRMALVDSSRFGSRPQDYETRVTFFAETNATTIAQLKHGEYHGVPHLMAWEVWTNREPEAFQKVGVYDVKATLLIRKDL